VTGKQTQPKTEAKAKEQRKCFSCDKPDSETLLLEIILPPTIMERQELCPRCLKITIDNSKERGKATIGN
jgi:hypothetical protein